MKRFLLAAIACVAVLFSDVVAGASAASLGSVSATDSAETLASAYCMKTGGTVVRRVPEYGTNGPSPLTLANPRNFCEYTAKDGSQIALLGATLYAVQPTLAALAYYAKVKPGTCQGNPASCYCSLLGGTDLFGGINAAGGGWVNNAAQNQVLDTCVFPDESSIDSFGLFYHSASIIRGIDLAKVLRYHQP